MGIGWEKHLELSISGAFLPSEVIYARTCSQVGASLHVHLHVESETQCTPTPRARKCGPFLGGTANREIFLTVRIPPKPSLSAQFFHVELASKGCAPRPASYLPVSDETTLNDHLHFLRRTFPANFPPSKGVCLTSYFGQRRKGLPSCLSAS